MIDEVGQPELPGDRDPERRALIIDHLALARSLARRYANRGESYEDLVQAASLALVKAADRFDPTRGVAFSTYATHTIVGELKHHLRDRGWMIRAPRPLQELAIEITKVVSELTQQLGRSPTVTEIALRCQRREDEVLAAMEAARGYRGDSLDDETAGSLADSHATGELLEETNELASHLSHLAPREREILRLRFVDELSQTEIAEQMQMSQMHVSRLLRRAIDSLRASYDVTDVED